MPVCLLCPTGSQPSFVKIGELSDHISEVHSTVRSAGNATPTALPHKPAGQPPCQPPTAIKCCICNKKFASPGALTAHQSAKRHYPPNSSPTPKFASSDGPVPQSETHGISSSSTAVNSNSIANKSDVVKPRVIQDNSLTQLQNHSSSHGHKKAEPSCNRQGNMASDVATAPHRSSSPAIVPPASSHSINNIGISSNARVKGFVCDDCKKVFKTLAGLQTHISVKHIVGAKCVICHFICPSTAALEEHVDAVHACAVCHDGILRDAQTLSDHMIEHSHPILCKRCGTRYRTEEERKFHFAADDNNHPVCVICGLGFDDDQALRAHTGSAHPTSPQPSTKPNSPRFSAGFGVDAHARMEHFDVFHCGVCHEAYSSQTELDVHVVTVHSCPICHDGTYMDMRSLEEHLERHRSPYVCHPCGLAYAEEDQLLEHYKVSLSDIHPRCEKCQLGFENNDKYTIHANEVHPRVACDVCESDFSDEGELAVHYSSSRKHPQCEKCGVGFRDRFDYTAHGATAHPECHCYLCQWHFDTPDILQNHIKHFSNHPKCQDCDIRFADADAYQHHLFTVHRPHFDDQGHFDISADRVAKLAHGDCSSPPVSARAFDPIWGFEGSASLPYASYIPLPPSLSGYSSPTSQREIAEFGGSSGSHSRSSTLSVEQRSPTDGGQPWNAVIPPLTLDVEQDCKVSPNFDHSPLSTLPAVGTPIISSAPTIQSADLRSPFSPRPEPPSLFSLSQGTDPAVTVVEPNDVDSDSSSSFTRSPPLVSPIVKLPDPRPRSPASTSSSWTMTSDGDSRQSTPQRPRISLSNGITSTFSTGQSATSDHTVPQLTLLVPSSAHNSGCPSSISPESAGISVSATMTPEYLREARAYLSLTHQVQEPESPASPRSPGISSPILSSTGLALGGRGGRRREVRFEDNIMTESAWDRRSTSSESPIDPPVALPRPSTGLRMNGVSKLPRFSALRRPNRRWANGQANHAYSRGHNRRPNVAPVPVPSYHCRSCYKDQCDEPTTTTCGHLFCYECISTAVMKDARCPVCDAPTLLYCLFRIDTSA